MSDDALGDFLTDETYRKASSAVAAFINGLPELKDLPPRLRYRIALSATLSLAAETDLPPEEMLDVLTRLTKIIREAHARARKGPMKPWMN